MQDRYSLIPFRIRLAWERLVLAVSERTFDLRIRVARRLLPAQFSIWLQVDPGEYVDIDPRGNDAFGI